MGPRDGESVAETVERHTLEALLWHWGDAYEITGDGGRWRAVRRDGLGHVEADGQEGLWQAIRDDYSARPVPRE